MASAFGTGVDFRKLDGNKFTLWKEIMQDVLIIRRHVEAIRHSEKPALMTTEEWRSIDKIMHSTIWMHLTENVYFRMAKETTTFSLWEKLHVVYEKNSFSSKLILIRQLFNMKMRESDPTTFRINTFSRVLSELSSQGINFEEEVKALTLLSSLRVSWEIFCTTFATSCSKLNLDELINQVLTEDIWRKSMGLTINDSVEAHNSIESFDRSNQSRKQAKRTGRNSSRSRNLEDWQRSKSRSNRSSALCKSHWRKSRQDVSDCWLIKRKESVKSYIIMRASMRAWIVSTFQSFSSIIFSVLFNVHIPD